LTCILPKEISERILFIFTNCENAIDLTFPPKDINQYFGYAKNHRIPFVCFENPFVYTEKARETIADGRATEKEALSGLKAKFAAASQ